MKRILMIGSQHGNELLGEKLYRYMKANHSELLTNITYVIGNPLAHAMSRRYVEEDMNRCYGGIPTTYEGFMAHGLMTHISRSTYDLVLDLHTTKCIQPPAYIIAEQCDQEVKNFISASTTQQVVIMGHPIVESSLIGNVAHALSVEIQHDEVNYQALETISKDIERYVYGGIHDPTVPQIYLIYDLIEKSKTTPAHARSLQNFVRCAAGYYPILVGNNSYRKNTDYLGFKARKVRGLSINEIGYNKPR